MADGTSMDVQRAHRHFAPSCFNETWEMLEALGDEPTPEAIDELVLTAAASLWHWTQRSDVTDQNLSVGAWLLARVYAVAKRHDEAMHWARRSLELAERAGEKPFYVGYAYEALARACAAAKPDEAREYEALAREHAASVGDEESRRLLVADLESLR